MSLIRNIALGPYKEPSYEKYEKVIIDYHEVPYTSLSSEESDNNMILFIVFYGNAEDIGSIGNMMKSISDVMITHPKTENYSFKIYSFERPGHGRHTHPFRDPEMAFDQSYKIFEMLKEKYKPVQIYFYGYSLGCVFALNLAEKVQSQINGLVLFSGFASCMKAKFPNMGGMFSFVDHFDNLEVARKIKLPVCLIHGQDDTRIYPQNLDLLSEAFSNVKVKILIPDADHTSIKQGIFKVSIFTSSQYFNGLCEYLDYTLQ